MDLADETYDQGSATTMIAAFDPELAITFTSVGLQIEMTPSTTTYTDLTVNLKPIQYHTSTTVSQRLRRTMQAMKQWRRDCGT